MLFVVCICILFNWFIFVLYYCYDLFVYWWGGFLFVLVREGCVCSEYVKGILELYEEGSGVVFFDVGLILYKVEIVVSFIERNILYMIDFRLLDGWYSVNSVISVK